MVAHQPQGDLTLMFEDPTQPGMGKEIELYSPLNARDTYPLLFRRTDNKEDGDVFNKNGTLTAEFIEYLDWLQHEAAGAGS